MKKYKIIYRMRDDQFLEETVNNSEVYDADELAKRLISLGRQYKSIPVSYKGSAFQIPFEQILYISVTEVS